MITSSSLPPNTPKESPKNVGVGCLIVFGMIGIVGGIMHFTGDDAAAPPASSAPATTQQSPEEENDLKSPEHPRSAVSDKPEAGNDGSPAKTNAFVAQANRDNAEGHAILIRRYSEGERRQIAVELVQAEDRAQSEAERRYPPEQVMAISTLQNQLTDRYVGRVLRKYHMDAKQRLAINVEAMDNKWPLPDPPPSP